MYSDLLLPYLQKEVMEGYFEICRYFLTTKKYGQPEDHIRMDYYRSLLQSGPLPPCSVKNKLDLEIIAATKEVKTKLSDTYSPEFMIRIIHSGIHLFFDRMERYSAIDVHLRSMPMLFSFFTVMTPIIRKELEEAVYRQFKECLSAS